MASLFVLDGAVVVCNNPISSNCLLFVSQETISGRMSEGSSCLLEPFSKSGGGAALS